MSRSAAEDVETTGLEKCPTGVWGLDEITGGGLPRSRYTIEVIDLVETPHLAAGDQILAIPTPVRKLPPPLRKIIGDLSDTEGVLVELDLKPRD